MDVGSSNSLFGSSGVSLVDDEDDADEEPRINGKPDQRAEILALEGLFDANMFFESVFSVILQRGAGGCFEIERVCFYRSGWAFQW